MIGETYLKGIEETTVKTSTQGAEEMQSYYQYWETRIFNALIIMILRAMASTKTLFAKSDKRPPLLKISAEYNHPEINYHPSKDELVNQLEKFSRNILDCAKQFGRWWKGFCKVFEEKPHPETGEKYIPFTFDDDVNVNPIIRALQYDILQARNQTLEKISYHSRGWQNRIKDKRLWDKNEMNKI